MCQVAYHGAPEKSYEVFVSALRARYLEQGLLIPSLEDHNPAGKDEVGGTSLIVFCMTPFGLLTIRNVTIFDNVISN